MTRSIPKLAPEDIIEWPDGEPLKIIQRSEFLPQLLTPTLLLVRLRQIAPQRLDARHTSSANIRHGNRTLWPLTGNASRRPAKRRH